MNEKAHQRVSALKARVDEYIIEVENNFISYTYETGTPLALLPSATLGGPQLCLLKHFADLISTRAGTLKNWRQIWRQTPRTK